MAEDDLTRKWAALQESLLEMAPVLVAYSGGVDSTLLLLAARETLGAEKVLAVTAHGDVHAGEELRAARDAAARLGVRHEVIETHELQIPGFVQNPPERCYLCKRSLYERLHRMAPQHGMKTVVDGANADDLGDYRPGMKAAEESGARSPLAEVGLNKAEIRALAREKGLVEWDKPSSPCLASRFPYGQQIDVAGLAMVAGAERYLRELGFSVLRVRHHNDTARIELAPDEAARLFGPGSGSDGGPAEGGQSVRRGIVEHLRRLGYRYVTLDLEGFRSGSLNEVLLSGTDERRSGDGTGG